MLSWKIWSSKSCIRLEITLFESIMSSVAIFCLLFFYFSMLPTLNSTLLSFMFWASSELICFNRMSRSLLKIKIKCKYLIYWIYWKLYFSTFISTSKFNHILWKKIVLHGFSRDTFHFFSIIYFIWSLNKKSPLSLV